MLFANLDPRPIPAAQAANDAVFASGPVLGIEVTIPALANRCVLGNIDPQHSGGDASRAAIEAALDAKLPPDGAVLATARADLDSVGAMAVMVIRAERGVEYFWWPCPCATDNFMAHGSFSCKRAPIEDRLRLVAEADRFARGKWPGPRPLPTEESLFDDSSASAETDSRLAPMAAAVSDFKIPLVERVEWMKRWLLTGEEPEGYRERWLDERRAIAKAVADGPIRAEKRGRIAVVVSIHRAATAIGYCLSPVVVALNPEFRFGGGEPHPKFTVCQFTADYADLRAVLAELSELEPGWGGSPTIIGSPQGAGSTLTIEQVVDVVERHTGGGTCYSCGRWPLKREQWEEGDWERCDFCGAGLA